MAHLVAVYGMNDGSCAEEQQGFKHGMSEEVEHGGHVAQSGMSLHAGDT